MVGTGVLHVLYFLFLSRGYRHGDMSVVYPVARGLGPALVPVLAFLALSEKVTPLALGGIGCVVLGMFAVHFLGEKWSEIKRRPKGFLF